MTATAWDDRRSRPVGIEAPHAEHPTAPRPEPAAPSPKIRETLSLPAVWLGAAMFFVYVGVEIGAGLWAFPMLTEDRGLGPRIAGLCVSAYWGSLFVGRLLMGALGDRIPPRRILAYAFALLIAGAALMAVPGPALLAVAGLMVMGFAAAPIFPLLTLVTGERVGPGHTDRAIGVQMGASGLGGALLPTTIGLVLDRWNAGLLGACLLFFSVVMTGLYVIASRPRAGRPTASRRGSPVSG